VRGGGDEALLADVAHHLVEIRGVEQRVGVDEGIKLPAGALCSLVAGRADTRPLLIDDDRPEGRRDSAGIVLAAAVDDDRLGGNLRVEVADPMEGLGEVGRLVVRRDHETDQRLGGVREPRFRRNVRHRRRFASRQ
jgi:hypothetical protein